MTPTEIALFAYSITATLAFIISQKNWAKAIKGWDQANTEINNLRHQIRAINRYLDP